MPRDRNLDLTDPTPAQRESLFRLGDFTLHSGARSRWKIDADALTDDDLAALAVMLAEKLPPFSSVVGVPRGGHRLAEAMWPHAGPDGTTLIVDDVLTRGTSMERARLEWPGAVGAVIFARGPCPAWVVPLFRMD